MFPPVKLSHYTYSLPAESIAQQPLENRDLSKLLVYRQGSINHHLFRELPGLLPEKTLLVMNDTRVVPARLMFRRHTGAYIEVFLLNPVKPSSLVAQAMTAPGPLVWRCKIGNLKKWKDGEVLGMALPGGTLLQAHLRDRDAGWVELGWEGEETFAEVLEKAGKLPLPPYIKHEPGENDRQHYQTIYAAHAGAVAAPTAGLHFTDQVLDNLEQQGVKLDYLTLHVSAGTFQPVKHEEAEKHPMHSEQFSFSAGNIRNWMAYEGHIIPVGTTSMRTLETAYWLGVKLGRGGSPFTLDKEYAYSINEKELPATREALSALLDFVEKQPGKVLTGDTSVYIVPGYRFRMCRGLVTNFHMPGTTLVLLVAALIGEDWKKVYDEALARGYRFLSYGDSSLLLP